MAEESKLAWPKWIDHPTEKEPSTGDKYPKRILVKDAKEEAEVLKVKPAADDKTGDGKLKPPGWK